MDTAARLKALRKENGFTRQEFATECNIPYSTLTNYENGTRTPPYTFLLTAAKLFGVTIDYLLCATNDPNPAPWENGLYGKKPLRDSAYDFLFNLGYRVDTRFDSESRIYLTYMRGAGGCTQIYQDELDELLTAIEEFTKNTACLLFQSAIMRETAEIGENLREFKDFLALLPKSE